MKKTLLTALIAMSGLSAHASDYFVVVPVPGKTANASDIQVTLSWSALLAGTVGVAYRHDFRQQLRVTGDSAYTGYGVKWSVGQGGLPAGLALDATTGVLSGTPAAGGTIAFTVQAKYKTQSAQQTYEFGAQSTLLQFSGYRAWSDGTYAASCSDYLGPSAPHSYAGATGDGVYRIRPAGSSTADVYCDMTTDGGGWTRVATAKGTAVYLPTTPINDLGLTYTHVLMAAASDMFTSYAWGADFKWTGISPVDGLRFGSTWYFIADTPAWRGFGTSQTRPWAVTLAGAVGWPNSNYTIVETNPAGSSCLMSASIPADLCARKMKVLAPAGQRLTGYNDIESLEGTNVDNTLTRNLDIFVR